MSRTDSGLRDLTVLLAQEKPDRERIGQIAVDLYERGEQRVAASRYAGPFLMRVLDWLAGKPSEEWPPPHAWPRVVGFRVPPWTSCRDPRTPDDRAHRQAIPDAPSSLVRVQRAWDDREWLWVGWRPPNRGREDGAGTAATFELARLAADEWLVDERIAPEGTQMASALAAVVAAVARAVPEGSPELDAAVSGALRALDASVCRTCGRVVPNVGGDHPCGGRP